MTPIKQIPTYLILLSAVITLSLFLASCGGGGDGDEPGPGPNGNSLEIVAFSPDSAYVGDEVQIQGLGFSPVQEENQVFFGGDAEATVENVSLTEGNDSGTILTTVPDGATDGPIAVSVNGGERAESGADFNVVEAEQQEEGEEFARVYWVGQEQSIGGAGNLIGTSYIDDQGRKKSEILYDSEDQQMEFPPIGEPFGVALDLNSNMVYWSSFSPSDPSFIARTSINGGGTIDTLYSEDEGDPVGYLAYIALDLESNQIYWASEDGIVRGSLKGREDAPAEVIYPAGENGFADYGAIGVDLQLDTENNYVYWTEFEENEIGRGSLDGSEPLEVLYTASDASPSLRNAYDMFVDTEGGKIYIGDGESSDGRILVGNTDGSGSLETLYSGDEYSISLSPLAMDPQTGFLYWSNGTSVDNGKSGVIMRGSADGSGETEVVYDIRELGDGVSSIQDLAVVPESGSAKAKGTGSGHIPPIYLEF